MNRWLRETLETAAFIAIVTLIWLAIPVQAHTIDCSGHCWHDPAHGERHQK